MLSKGQKINDRYEIIKSIGEGGMANVYLAQDTVLERNVAIKVLRGDLADNEKFIRRFQREAKSVSDLSHPNIVEVYDVGEEDGQHYIVMEYIDGKTLKQLLQKRGTLTVPEVVDIMTQLTDGMAAAHDAYIIHRDIKPQNIMILDNGMIKITDFGIATSMNATQLTQTNSVMGSVHYLPPEQAAGQTATIKSDIYSLGILMYELLTGSVPFKGDNAGEIARKQMKERIPSVRKQNPLIPQSIENIIIKATAKNPKNRYDNVKEMHDDIVHALDPEKENEEKYIYKYPESETEELPIKETTAPKKEVNPPRDDDEEITSPRKESAKDKKKIIIISSIIGGIFIILLALIIIFNARNNSDVKVPDVTNKEVAEAIKILKGKGFKYETEKKDSDEIKKGRVIETSPKAGSTKKKGSTIKIIESTGTSSYTLEDFTGENYHAIEEKLKNLGLDVKVEKKSVENSSDYVGNEDIIIDQEPKFNKDEKTKLKKGDKVTLYIPDIVSTYPDMVSEGWTLSDAEAFAKQYDITIKVKDTNGKVINDYEEYLSEAITNQSRPAGDNIISGITLTLTINVDTQTYSLTANYYLQKADGTKTTEAIKSSSVIKDKLKNGEKVSYACESIGGYSAISTSSNEYTINGKNLVINCYYTKNDSTGTN